MTKWINYHITMWANSNDQIPSYFEWKKKVNYWMTKWLNYCISVWPYFFKVKLPAETPNDIQLTSLECTKKTKLPNDHTSSILSKWPKTLNTFPKH